MGRYTKRDKKRRAEIEYNSANYTGYMQSNGYTPKEANAIHLAAEIARTDNLIGDSGRSITANGDRVSRSTVPYAMALENMRNPSALTDPRKAATVNRFYDNIINSAKYYAESGEMKKKDAEKIIKKATDHKNVMQQAIDTVNRPFEESRVRSNVMAPDYLEKTANYRKYGSMDYKELMEAKEKTFDPKEKEWIDAYAKTKRTPEDIQTDIDTSKGKIEQARPYLSGSGNTFAKRKDPLSAAAKAGTQTENGTDTNDTGRTSSFEDIRNEYIKNNPEMFVRNENEKIAALEKEKIAANVKRDRERYYENLKNKEDYKTYAAKDLPAKEYASEDDRMNVSRSDNTDSRYNRPGSDEHVGRLEANEMVMTRDEKDKYNYLYHTQGKKAAADYLKFIQEDLTQRRAKVTSGNINNYAEAMLYKFGSGMERGLKDAGENIHNFITGDEALPVNENQYVSAIIDDRYKDAGPKILGRSIGQMALDTSETIGNMAPSVLMSSAIGGPAGPAIGAAMMGISAGANAANEAWRDSGDKTASIAYGVVNGILEGGLQYGLGGIGKVGGKLAGFTKNSLKSKIGNTAARAFANLGISAASEGTEEYLQDIIDPAMRNLFLGEKNKINFVSQEALYSYLQGAVTSLIMGGLGDVTEAVREGRLSDLGAVSRMDETGIIDAANYYGLEDSVKEYENSAKSDIDLGKLKNDVMIEENKAAVSNIGKDNAGSEDAIIEAARYMGLDNIAKEYENSKKTDLDLGELVTQTDAGIGNDIINAKTVEEARDIYEDIIEEAPEYVKNKATEAFIERSMAEAKTRADEASKTDTMSENAKNVKKEMLKNTNASAENFDSDFNYYYGYGRAGMDFETANESGQNINPYSELTENEKLLAWQQGANDRDIHYNEAVPGRKNKGIFSAIKADEITDEMRANGIREVDLQNEWFEDNNTAMALMALSDLHGINTVVYASDPTGENGEKTAPNGWYDPNTNTIYLDVTAENAGKNASVMVYAHEFTHSLKENAPVQYKDLTDYIIRSLSKADKGAALDTLVNKQLDLAKANGITLTREQAVDEVIAEASQELFKNSKAIEELYKSEPGLFNKIKEWIKEIIANIKSVLSKTETTSEEAKILREYLDDMSEAQKLYDNAAKASIKRKTETKDGSTNAAREIVYNTKATQNQLRSTTEVDSLGRKLSSGQSEYFKDSAIRDEDGALKVMYHGTSRADRVGTVFRADRATSGPFAYFTDNEDIGTRYSKDKGDTSIDYDEQYKDYFTQFRMDINGKNMSISDAWRALSAEKRRNILEKAKHVTLDDEAADIIYDENEKNGTGNYEYHLNNSNGNALKALTYLWLEDGTLFGEENRFLDVLKLAGLDDVIYMDPRAEYNKTYEVYLNVKNPFNPTNISEEVAKKLKKVSEGIVFNKNDHAGMYNYDKKSISPEMWIDKLERDIKRGTTHAWTIIPDWVTDVIKSEGYDGIIDKGGKNGGAEHTVVIPFYSNQVKDVNNANPSENEDIRYSLRDNTSDRAILADALDTAAVNEEEKRLLKEYRQGVKQIETMEYLAKEMDKAAATADTAAERDTFRKKADIYREAVNAADKKLLSLEATKPIKDLLKRESEARKKEGAEEIVKRYAARDERKHMTALRNRTKSEIESLTRSMIKPNKKDYVPEKLKNSVGEFIQSIDFVSRYADPNSWNSEQWRSKMEKLAKVLGGYNQDGTKADKSKGETGIGTDPTMFAPDLLNQIDTFIENNAGKNISDLDSAALVDLYIITRKLRMGIRNYNRMYTNKRFESVERAGYETIEMLDEKKTRSRKRDIGVIRILDKLFNVDMLEPKSYFKRFGKAGESIYESIAEGDDRNKTVLQDASDYVAGVYKKLGIDEKTVRKWNSKKSKQSFDVRGNNITMTPLQIMTLYELSKRDQAMRHINRGGIRIEGEDVISVNDKDPSGKQENRGEKAVTLFDDEVKMITDTLTDEQKALADELQKWMANEGAAYGNDVSMKMYGSKNFTEPNYFPIKTDSNSRNASTNEDAGNANLYRILNLGMTKTVDETARNAVIIRDIMSAFSEHVADMASYYGYAMPIADAMKWFNYRYEIGHETKSVRNEMDRVFGKATQQYFKTLLADINGNTALNNDNVFDKMTGAYKAAAVGGNVRVVIQQPLAYLRALNVMNPKYLSKGLVSKNNIEEMEKYAPIAWWKNSSFRENGMGKSLKSTLTNDITKREWMTDFLTKPAGWADKVTWGKLWNAVKYEVKDQYGNMEYEDFMKKTARRFRQVVDETQVVDTKLSRSQLMRNQNGLTKLATAFMMEPTKTYNMLYDAYTSKNGKKIARATAVWALENIVLVAIKSAYDSFRRLNWSDDEKEKDYLQRFLDSAKTNAADDFNPFNMIPFIKELPGAFETILSDNDNNRAQRFDMQWLYDTADATKKVIKFYNGDNNEKDGVKALESVLKTLSNVSGVPVSNIWREGKTIANSVLYQFMNRDTVPEQIRRAAQYKYDGEFDKYKAERKKILEERYVSGEKKITSDEFIKMVDSEFTKIKKAAEGDTKDKDEFEQDKAMYKIGDAKKAVSDGNYKYVQEILDEIYDAGHPVTEEQKADYFESKAKSFKSSLGKLLYKDPEDKDGDGKISKEEKVDKVLAADYGKKKEEYLKLKIDGRPLFDEDYFLKIEKKARKNDFDDALEAAGESADAGASAQNIQSIINEMYDSEKPDNKKAEVEYKKKKKSSIKSSLTTYYKSQPADVRAKLKVIYKKLYISGSKIKLYDNKSFVTMEKAIKTKEKEAKKTG